jgi:hypothetical protein
VFLGGAIFAWFLKGKGIGVIERGMRWTSDSVPWFCNRQLASLGPDFARNRLAF